MSDMLNIPNVDASQWPFVRSGNRAVYFTKGLDYVELSTGIHLTAEGLGKLAWVANDIDLQQMYLARRDRARARLALNLPTNALERMREMHRAGES